MNNEDNLIKIIPVLLIILIAGLISVFSLTLSQTRLAGLKPYAAESASITLAGFIRPLDKCVLPDVCFQIFNDADGKTYLLSSKKYSKLFSGKTSLWESAIDYRRYLHRKVKIQAIYVPSSPPYIITLSISD